MGHPVSPWPAHSTTRGSSAPLHGPGGRRGEASGAVWEGAPSELSVLGGVEAGFIHQSPLQRGLEGHSWALHAAAPQVPHMWCLQHHH